MESKPTIFILGSGAIGLALAINLILHNRDVILVRTSIDGISLTETTISMKTEKDGVIKVPVQTVSLNKLSFIEGVIVISTKSHVNNNLASQLKKKNVNSSIVILQNGLGVEESFLQNNFPEIFRCVLFATSQVTGKDFVSYRPIAPSPIGIIKGQLSRLKIIINLLNTPNFQFIFEENINEVIWQKAIINSVFNSICPLLEIDNGVFHRNEKVLDFAMQIVNECVTVGNFFKVNLSIDKIRDQIITISRLSDGQLISTLQDLQNHRKTEITFLNLEIARLAEPLDSKIFPKVTKILGHLILLKSEISMK